MFATPSDRVLHLPHAKGSVSAAHRWLVAELKSVGLSGPVLDDAALLAAELVGNAIRHASPTSSGDVVLSWCPCDNCIRIEVSDGGSVSLPEPAVVQPSGAVLSTSGRGLRIVEQLCQKWGFLEVAGSGRTVWAELSTGASLDNECAGAAVLPIPSSPLERPAPSAPELDSRS